MTPENAYPITAIIIRVLASFLAAWRAYAVWGQVTFITLGPTALADRRPPTSRWLIAIAAFLILLGIWM